MFCRAADQFVEKVAGENIIPFIHHRLGGGGWRDERVFVVGAQRKPRVGVRERDGSISALPQRHGVPAGARSPRHALGGKTVAGVSLVSWTRPFMNGAQEK
ncbi:hypothetical protein E2C01_092246 [Portunus trituberculatus]|uniref:Uncharacterized protein n=1 Tax=Portunus trituberculatus TaxID=210409 RepID=A0A5B7JR85_PORTR|nr:hypothetical protein [Portunus trituberculatus]